MFTAVNRSRPSLIRLRGDFIFEQSTYLIRLLWGAGGRGGGTEAGDAASLITIDIATQKKRGTGQRIRRRGWEQREAEDPCSLFN